MIVNAMVSHLENNVLMILIVLFLALYNQLLTSIGYVLITTYTRKCE
jgi:hypothetical protein